MGAYMVSVAAASAGVGIDLFSGEVWSRAPRNRVLNGFGIRGSAAAVDTQVEVYIDETRVGNFYNVGTGVPNNDDLVKLNNLGVPAGAQARCIVRTAPTTNPINLLITLDER